MRDLPMTDRPPLFHWSAHRTAWGTAVCRALTPLLGLLALVAIGVAIGVGTAGPEATAQQAAAPPGLQREQVALREELGWVQPFDLDGDGWAELIVVEAERGHGRDVPYTLRVLRGTPAGYAPLEPATVPLPPHVSLLEVGYFRGGPGLALLRPGEVLIWPWRDGRFAAEAALRHPVDSLFPVPGGELKQGLLWLADLSGDGRSEVLVPRFDGLEVLAQAPDGTLRRHALLRLRAQSRLLDWYKRSLLAYDLPAISVQQVDGRGWQDLVVFLDGMLWVFLLDGDQPDATPAPALVRDLQPPKPFDPAEPWDPPLRLVKTADLNADGLFDLIVSKNAASDSQFNTRTSVLVFFGRTGLAGAPIDFPAAPAHAFVTEGVSLPLVLDLSGNGRRDLVLVNVEIGFWNVIKALVTRSVNARAAFYRMLPEGRYPRDPQQEETYAVTFSLGRFSHQPIADFADLNGDGLPDLLLSRDKETLGIHWGRKDGVWAGDPDVRLTDHMPTNGKRMRVFDLDGDGRDDLLFAYDRNDIRQMPAVNHTLAVRLSRYGSPSRRTVHR